MYEQIVTAPMAASEAMSTRDSECANDNKALKSTDSTTPSVSHVVAGRVGGKRIENDN
jgi:hypothetical protein